MRRPLVGPNRRKPAWNAAIGKGVAAIRIDGEHFGKATAVVKVLQFRQQEQTLRNRYHPKQALVARFSLDCTHTRTTLDSMA